MIIAGVEDKFKKIYNYFILSNNKHAINPTTLQLNSMEFT